MVQTIQASIISIDELELRFGLNEVESDQFFREWQDDLPEITVSEKQILDRVKAGYLNLLKNPSLLKSAVRMAVLSPLLFFADFYLYPFHIKSEKSVRISESDEGVIVEGKIDVLILFQQLWIMVIESKQAAFSIEAGLAQFLTYMLANPNREKPSFGMITTGGSFIFVKLVKGETPQYALSDEFVLRKRGNELYSVLSILKRFGQLAINN